jgi:sugar phosphate permease
MTGLLIPVLYVSYVLYYVLRKALGSLGSTGLIPWLDKPTLGSASSSFNLAYSAGKLLAGPAADNASPRVLLCLGLVGSAAVVFLCSFSNAGLLVALYVLHGLLQSLGWPAITKYVARLPQTQRGSVWSILSTAQNVGTTAAPYLMVFLAHSYGWRGALVGVAALSSTFAVVSFFLLPASEQAIAPEPGPRTTPMTKKTSGVKPEKQAAFFAVLRTHLSSNRGFWVLCLLHFSVYCARTALTEWMVMYLIEARGFDAIAAASAVFAFEAGGFVGSLSSGPISDRAFGGNRKRFIFVSLSLFFGSVVLFFSRAIPVSAGSALMGAFSFGPTTMLGLFASEVVPERVSVTAVSVAGAVSAFGSSFAGLPLSIIVSRYGWRVLGYWAGGFALLSIAFLAVILNTKERTQKEK